MLTVVMIALAKSSGCARVLFVTCSPKPKLGRLDLFGPCVPRYLERCMFFARRVSGVVREV